MKAGQLTEEDIFEAAVNLSSPADRDAFLVRVCDGNEILLNRMRAMLQAHDHPILTSSPLPDAVSAGELLTSASGTFGEIGTCIGPYKLLEQIGEGGMGVVFVAQQSEPVRRKVALKIIKPGMDSREVISRFQSERQALALMDHPNIAKVLDAGTTDSGRPYFVMELVRGMPITEYCDKAKLAQQIRLKLFMTVCQAIQHAHQKGIIHRDLKPSNILITMNDGQMVVKVIDFGVAKALHQKLSDHTIYTAFSQIIGTPMYMSPEQAELTSLDIDTRSDVYSLGVLLYELLTGQTPFNGETLRRAGLDEMRRIIREEEPLRPSQRLSTLDARAMSTCSQQRGLDERGLRQILRGELDWIVMKALEKDRNRRYESASAFAADIERYLHHEAVLACPPSTWYRASKFVQRRRAMLVTIALVASALIVGTVVSLWQAAEATQAQSEAETKRLDAERNLELAREAVDKLVKQIEQATLPPSPQFDSIRRTLLDEAIGFYTRLLAQKGTTPAVRLSAARAWRKIGEVKYELTQFDEAIDAYEQSFLVLKNLLVDFPEEGTYMKELAEANQALAFSEMHSRWDKSRAGTYLQTSHKMWRSLVAIDSSDWNRLQLAFVEMELDRLNGKLDESSFRQQVELQRTASEQHPENCYYRANLAHSERDLATFLASHGGEAKEIEMLYDRSAEHFERAARDGFPERNFRIDLAYLLQERSGYLEGRQRTDEAERCLRQALEHYELLGQKLLLGHRDEAARAMCRTHLGEIMEKSGRFNEAEQMYRLAVDELTHSAWGQWWIASTHLAALLKEQQSADAAADFLAKFVAKYQAALREPSGEVRDDPLLVITELMRAEAAGEDVSVERALVKLEQTGLMEPTKNIADAWVYRVWKMTRSSVPAFPRTAVALAEHAAQLKPDQFATHRAEGIARYRALDYAGAIVCLKRAVQLKPEESPTAWLFLAMAYSQQRDAVQARDWYTKASDYIASHEDTPKEIKELRDDAKTLIEK